MACSRQLQKTRKPRSTPGLKQPPSSQLPGLSAGNERERGQGNGAKGRCPEKPIRTYVQGACFPSPKAWPKSQRAPSSGQRAHGEQIKATRGRAASRERNDGTVVAGTHALAVGKALFCQEYSIEDPYLPNVLCSPALCVCVRACPGWSGVVNTSPGNPEPNDGANGVPKRLGGLPGSCQSQRGLSKQRPA